MKALLGQLACRIGDLEGNTQRVIDALRHNAEADIAVFPELYLSGYTYREMRSTARPLECDEIRAIAAAAAETKTAVIVGFAELTDRGVANSVACIDEGGQDRGRVYEGLPVPARRKGGLPGRRGVPHLRPRRRRVAPLICYDIEFPEPARQVMLAGAEILATASGNMEPLYLDHAIGVVARAHENRLPHLYANMTGFGEDGLVFVGGSRCVAPTGEVVAEASRDREELIVVTVPEAGGYDPYTHYPTYLRPPLPVRHVPGAAASRGSADRAGRRVTER